jgi:transglutaminase-like putative cysteine protease
MTTRLFISIIISGLLCSVCWDVYAQPDSKHALAAALRTKYPQEEVAALKMGVEIEFGIDAETSKAVAYQTTEIRLISLTAGCLLNYSEFYDDQSEVERVEVLQESGKPYDVFVKDAYYQQAGIFYSDARQKVFSLSFPSQDYVLTLRIKKKYKDIRYFTTLYMSESFPVAGYSVRFVVPDYVRVDFAEFNFERLEGLEKRSVYNDKLGQLEVEYRASYLMPLLNQGAGLAGTSYLYPHILLLPKYYMSKGVRRVIFNTTDDLYKWYQLLAEKVKVVSPEVLAQATLLTAGVSSPLEKAKILYYWVQDNIRYVAFEDGLAGFKPSAGEDVLKNKYGDCKGMANLTKQLLTSVGLDARLAWIGTKRVAYKHNMPTLAVDNHMICVLLLDGKRYYLDATEGFTPLGRNAFRIQGREVLVENGTSYTLDTIPNDLPEHNAQVISQKLVVQGTQLTGSVHYRFAGECRNNFVGGLRNIQSDKLDESIRTYLSSDSKYYKVFQLNHTELGDRDKPLELWYETGIGNAVSDFGEELYIDLDHYKDFGKFYIENEQLYDYYFPHPIYQETSTSLELPTNYTAQFLPDDFVVKSKSFIFDVRYQVFDDKIIYHKKIVIPNGIIPKQEISLWNETITRLTSFYNSQVVLQKQ